MPAAPGAPLATFGIIAVCVAVWFGEQASLAFFDKIAFVLPLAQDEPWRYITSGFGHEPGSVMHLVFNMMALYFMGQYLEPMLGRLRFVALYLVSILGGSLGFQLLTGPVAGASSASLIGASGGVFGLFVAVVVLNRHLGREIGSMLTLIGVNVVLGFAVSHVAWQAHLGGAVVGGVGAGLLFALRRRSSAVQLGSLAALAAVLFALAYLSFAVVETGWFHIA